MLRLWCKENGPSHGLWRTLCSGMCSGGTGGSSGFSVFSRRVRGYGGAEVGEGPGDLQTGTAMVIRWECAALWLIHCVSEATMYLRHLYRGCEHYAGTIGLDFC